MMLAMGRTRKMTRRSRVGDMMMMLMTKVIMSMKRRRRSR